MRAAVFLFVGIAATERHNRLLCRRPPTCSSCFDRFIAAAAAFKRKFARFHTAARGASGARGLSARRRAALAARGVEFVTVGQRRHFASKRALGGVA